MMIASDPKSAAYSALRKTSTCLLMALATGALFVFVSCGKRGESSKSAEKTTLTIFCAGSLSRGMNQVARAYETEHPGSEIKIEATSSNIVMSKWLQLGRYVDIVALADYLPLIEDAMPEHADWCAAFATNRMVIAYTERSRFTSEINGDNWFEILARAKAQVGRADPNKDPGGYRTEMVLKLADLYYDAAQRQNRSIYDSITANQPLNNIRPSSMELSPLLQSKQLDYAFEYLSFAIQHNLKYVELPDQINLGNPKHEDFYGKVSVETSGKKPGERITHKGSAITYGITINRESKYPRQAADFVAFLLGTQGRKVFESEGVPMLETCRFIGKNVPEAILLLQPAKEQQN